MTQVWKTRRGSRYHCRPDCSGISDGHAEAASRGYPTYAPEPEELSNLNEDVRPCAVCWAPHFTEDRWLPAQLETEVKADSTYELDFYNGVLRRLEPRLDPDYLQIQAEATGASGTVYRVDFAIRRPGRASVAIEIDGFVKDKQRNESDEARQSSMSTRQNDLVNNGWKVLRFTNRQVATEAGKCRTSLEQALLGDPQQTPTWQRPESATPDTGTAHVPDASVTEPVSGDHSRASAGSGRNWGKIVIGGAVAGVAIIGLAVWATSAEDGAEPDSDGNCPSSHPIKGNISDDQRIYHQPGSEFYTQTRAEECFASTTDAEGAGYRASRAG